MGYNTYFDGILSFKEGLQMSLKAFALLMDILQVNKKRLKVLQEANVLNEYESKHLESIDLRLSPDGNGLMWDGSEKTANLPEKIEILIKVMRSECPDFGLYGNIFAYGCEFDDPWEFMVDGADVIITA